jgi:hypothetical protein
VKIGPAHSARLNSHKQLPFQRPWLLYIPELKRLLRLIQDHRAHI